MSSATLIDSLMDERYASVTELRPTAAVFGPAAVCQDSACHRRALFSVHVPGLDAHRACQHHLDSALARLGVTGTRTAQIARLT